MRALTLCLFLTACADPCADLGAPTLELAGASPNGTEYEAFEEGATRALLAGLQGGAHVWLQARMSGVCPDTAVLDRRVVDTDTGEILTLGRGPLDFVEVEDGTFELRRPARMALCPTTGTTPIDGRAVRFVVSAEDAEGRRADAERGLVVSCEGDSFCEGICAPEP